MKNFLIGILLLPALIGAVTIHHTLIDEKPDMWGQPMTNRIARAELVWLAMNKPKLFVEDFPQLAMDVEARHGRDDRLLQKSGVFDPEYFAARHPDLTKALGDDPAMLELYWLKNQDKCLQSAAHFDVKTYLERYPDVAKAYDGDCRMATLHWLKWGKTEGRNPLPKGAPPALP
jgi:hypothetical protein